MRYFIVGDIHGCSDQLRVLIEHRNLYQGRQVVFLGDYVDVGTDSRSVIDQLIQFRQRYGNSILLEGNHESALKSFLRTGDFVSYAAIGGLATLRAYSGKVFGDVRKGFERAFPIEHRNFLNSLETYLETKQYLFSHAGYSPSAPLDRSRESMVLRSHQDLFTKPPTLNKLCVCGHYFQKTLMAYLSDRVICLDTGCGILDGPLTAALLPERALVQVNVDLELVTTEPR